MRTGLAHVEHVDLAAAAHRAGLDDERRRLRDRHEEARHLRVRDRDGAAALDLPAEDRDHRAGRAEHVAEPHRDEPGRDVGSRSADDSTIHSQTAFDWPITFFAFAALSVEISTKRSTPASIAASTSERVPRMLFDDRLQRVRLEHRARACRRRRGTATSRLVALEDLPHLRAVAAVGEHRDRRLELALVDELALDLEERRLGLVDEHEPRGAEARELPAELGADRAAGAGDEHGLVPARRSRRASRSTSTCWRPSTSSTCTGRICAPRLTSPEISSCRPGSVFTGTPSCAARPRRSSGAPSRARTGSRSAPRRAGCRAAGAAGRRRVPSTRTPLMRSPRLRGSSSTKPIGV